MSTSNDRFLVDSSLSRPVRRTVSDARTPEAQWTRQYRAILRVTDATLIVTSLAVAFITRFGLDRDDTQVPGFGLHYASICVTLVVVWILALYGNRTYDVRTLGVGTTEYRKVASATAFAFGVLGVVFLVAKLDFARGLFMLALPLGVVALEVNRLLWRRWLGRQSLRGRFLLRAVIVGSSIETREVAEQLMAKSGAVYNVVGLAMDDATSHVTVGSRDIPVIASRESLLVATENLDVDAVIVAGQVADDSAFIRKLSWSLERSGAELVLASRLTDVAGPRIHFRPIEGLPLIQVEVPRFEGSRHIIKRAFDVILSGLGLIVLAPLFALVAIVIKLDSAGPVIYAQERIGRDLQPFTMFKFRSMVDGAHAMRHELHAENEAVGPLFKLRADPRVTRAGRVLRKYSLDELPQLWNVFLGHMSLVGPRPPLPDEVASYDSTTHRRLYIKPGLTGLWQVSGRSDLDWDESVRLDLYYVENWSIVGDMILLWRTAKTVLTHKGAY